MKTNKPSITVGVPAYSRPEELNELIVSILHSDELPDELLICEDKSPDRLKIREVVSDYQSVFNKLSCNLVYIENKVNLGYDGNVRNVITNSSCDYVLILGNDDALFPNAITTARKFLLKNPNSQFVSRTYSRFFGSVSNIINTTWISKEDFIFTPKNTSANLIFRLCGFVGGLVINKDWAEKNKTERYDGYLYYQFYLAAKAFFDQGIGYISESIVAGRAGNPPLFGGSSVERDDHVPGSYKPKGRAKMWSGILQIASDIEKDLGVSFYNEIKKELSRRQAFHIFEMMPTQGRAATLELFFELRKIGLTNNIVPWVLTFLICIFGKYSSLGFILFRKFQFFVEKNLKFKM